MRSMGTIGKWVIAILAVGMIISGPVRAAEQCVTSATVSQAERYYDLNKPRAPGHGYNWFQILLAFGERDVSDWTADNRTVEPMSAAEARLRVARWWGWRPFAEALECLEAQVVVVEEPEPEPQPVIVDPLDLEGGAGKAVTPIPVPVVVEEPQPEPQNQAPTVTANFKVYWHGGTMPTSNVDWRISENDYWQSEVIVQFELPTVQTNDSTTVFCVGGGVWDGPDYWHRGPFRMSGITTFADEFSGQYACTDPIDSSDAVTRESITGGNRFTYRGTILTRDNNVVEKDLDVGRLLFTFGVANNSQSYGRTNQTPTTHYIPATEMVADRVAYRLLRDKVAWPDYPHPEFALGDGSSWNTKRRDDTTCGEVAKSRWTDRAHLHTGRYVQDLVRANDETLWVLDHCYATKEVLSDPLTSAATILHENNQLPVIEDDEVAYLNVRNRGGKWTYSVSKPIVQEEVKGRPATCSNWAQRKDFVYLEILKGPSLYVELPAGDVSDYDMRKAKIATGCNGGDIQYSNSGATLSAICVGTINRQRLNGVLLDAIWIGGWGEVKKSNNDQIVFEQAGTIVNLCQ